MGSSNFPNGPLVQDLDSGLNPIIATGGGGSESLSQVLGVGNTTDGTSIVLSSGDFITSDSGDILLGLDDNNGITLDTGTTSDQIILNSIGIISIGDINGAQNQTKIGISDNTSSININSISGQIIVGDVNGDLNGTKIVTDGTSDTINVSSGTFSMNGNPGLTGTFNPVTSITVVNGIITAIS